jgi:hypothetical protein
MFHWAKECQSLVNGKMRYLNFSTKISMSHNIPRSAAVSGVVRVLGAARPKQGGSVVQMYPEVFDLHRLLPVLVRHSWGPGRVLIYIQVGYFGQ